MAARAWHGRGGTGAEARARWHGRGGTGVVARAWLRGVDKPSCVLFSCGDRYAGLRTGRLSGIGQERFREKTVDLLWSYKWDLLIPALKVEKSTAGIFRE